jgi:sugar lactone lactonase YvrE
MCLAASFSPKFSSLCSRISPLLLLTILLLPAIALAQVSYTGTPVSVSFSSQAIGSPSAANTLNFSITAGTTVGSIGVLTQGAPNLDFANAAGSTCTAKTYSSAANCTVNVTFTPRYAGSRMGAVVFFSAANNTGTVLANVPVYGIGTGPQIAYTPSAVTAIVPMVDGIELDYPRATAMDGAGNLFISDYGHSRVLKIPAGGGAAVVFASSLIVEQPAGLVVDGAGDLFIVGFSELTKVPVGGGTPFRINARVNGISLFSPQGLAVDGVGNLFIADVSANQVVEVPANGGAAFAINPTVNGVKLSGPEGVAVDGAGNLFIADNANQRVVEVPVDGSAAKAIDLAVNDESNFPSRVAFPSGVAIDGAGDLFITDSRNGRVVEVPAGGGAATTFNPIVNSKALFDPRNLSIDSVGNLYIADGVNNRMVVIQRSQPSPVIFTSQISVGTTDTIDGTQTAQIQNIGNEPLNFTAIEYPTDFSDSGGDTNACTSSTRLSAGQQCEVPVVFTPQTPGSLSESVTLTDNALNVAGAQQLIGVSGTTGLLLPASGSKLTSSSVTFTWASAAGATRYNFWLGTSGAGSNNIYFGARSTATSATVTHLPVNGATIYARLWTQFNGVWSYADYTFTAVGPGAALTSPAQGATLAGTSQSFTWASVAGASGYTLYLGTSIGSGNLLNAHTTTTTVTANNLPVSGATIYARLWTNFNVVWTYADYTFTAQAPAMLTSPTQGATFGGSSQTFTWTSVPGATSYTLYLGTSVGSGNLLNAHTTATTVTANHLPVNGSTIFARLWTNANGVWTHTDYTFTAQYLLQLQPGIMQNYPW